MNLQRNFYEVLGVPQSATTEQIKIKYRELARKFHPDVAQDKTAGQKIFSQINQAYRILSDPERRAQYNSSLLSEQQQARTAAAQTANKPQPAGSPVARPAAGTVPNGTASRPVSGEGVSSADITRLLAEADTALMQGRTEDARAACERILKGDPRNVKALGMLGDALEAMSRRDEAINAYRRALQGGANPLIQAKLTRLASAPGSMSASRPASAPTRPSPAPAMAGRSSSSSAQTPAKPAGGLFGRFLGKK